MAGTKLSLIHGQHQETEQEVGEHFRGVLQGRTLGADRRGILGVVSAKTTNSDFLILGMACGKTTKNRLKILENL